MQIFDASEDQLAISHKSWITHAQQSKLAAGDTLPKVIAAEIRDAKIQGLFAINRILWCVPGIGEIDGENTLQVVIPGIPFVHVFGIGATAGVEVWPFLVKDTKTFE